MAQSKGGARKLLWIMVGLILLSIVAAGISVYLAWQSGEGSEVEDDLSGERRSPIFVDIEPFTINMQSSRGVSHLLYVGMTFMVGDAETRAILVDHMPQVRSRLLMQLSAQQADEITSIEGKTALAANLINALQEPPLADYRPELAIEEVLFTEFIVQ